MADQTETAEHNAVGSIRMFRNDSRYHGMTLFPDGIVKIQEVSDRLPPRYAVEYVGDVDGLEGHRFWVEGSELTRPTQPVIDAEAWWVVVMPDAHTPTFYLNGAVQGIVDHDHAARVASEVTGRPVTAAQIERLTDILS